MKASKTVQILLCTIFLYSISSSLAQDQGVLSPHDSGHSLAEITSSSSISSSSSLSADDSPRPPTYSWNFDSSFINDANLLDNAQLVTGVLPHKGLVQFDGKLSAVRLATLNVGGSAISFRVIGRVQANGFYTRLWELGSGAGINNILLCRVESTDTWAIRIHNEGIKTFPEIKFPLPPGEWMDVVTVLDRDSNISVWVNGLQVASQQKFGAVTRVPRTMNWLGRSSWWAFEGMDKLNGQIDYFGIWDGVALTEKEIKNMFDQVNKKPCEVNNGGCDPLQQCVPDSQNPYNPPMCGNCPSGYFLNNNGVTSRCIDLNECASNNGGCDPRTTCVNTIGSRTCGACPLGYVGTGEQTCMDLDECQVNNGGCDTKRQCVNTVGSRTCGDCPVGYVNSGELSCADIDECRLNNGGCDPMRPCANTIGSRNCGPCRSGYKLDNEMCIDIDECAINNGGCDFRTRCLNKVGSRDCGPCPPGYKGSGEGGCVDINECLTQNGGCDPKTSCFNTDGSRTCGPCPKGWGGEGSSGCIDIDECQSDHGGCAPEAECKNLPGSSTCGACPNGYQGDGKMCKDINECLADNGGCDPQTTCTNIKGSRRCGLCPKCYKGRGESGCIPVNMCEVIPNGGCDPLTKCTMEPKSQGCRSCGVCPPGMVGDGYSGCRPDLRYLRSLDWTEYNLKKVRIDDPDLQKYLNMYRSDGLESTVRSMSASGDTSKFVNLGTIKSLGDLPPEVQTLVTEVIENIVQARLRTYTDDAGGVNLSGAVTPELLNSLFTASQSTTTNGGATTTTSAKPAAAGKFMLFVEKNEHEKEHEHAQQATATEQK